MAITLAQISALAGRYTNEIVNEQANLEAPFAAKTLKRLKRANEVGVVNIKAGEFDSTAFVADAGLLPDGSDVQPVQGTYQPVGLFSRIRLPRIAAGLVRSTSDGIDLVKEEMESCGASLARQLGRGVFGQSLGSPTATVNTTSTTFTVVSPSGWRVGMAFAVYNGASHIEGDTQATVLRVTKVDIPADGVGDTTITFVAAGGAGNTVQWLTTYTFWLRGANVNRMTSMADITAAASLYGQSQNSNEWAGNLDSTTTVMTIPALRALLTTVVRRRGMKPSHIVSNRKNEERYSNLLINNRRFMQGKMDAVGGAAFELEGIPWITDENVDDTDVFFFQEKDVKLHEFRDFQPDIDGTKKTGMNIGAALISDTNLVYDVQVWGAFNLRVERRNGTGRMSALTG